MKQLNRISRFLSLVLRHRPEQIDIELEKEGWADVATILQKLDITKDDLDHIVNSNDKQRFHYDESGMKIRAAQGHSKELDVTIDMNEYIPEVGKYLYHGTSNSNLDKVVDSGIKPMTRKDVHLSIDEETAVKVGKRRDRNPVILTIDARKMYIDGHKFRISKNGVVLCDFVPPEYISTPEV